ncbi:MAG TPA: lipid-binding SYLF domain-containing protein [Ideonella sp.]|uniref:lipid-binding SYLF domain-containing protein n=1 Tax=Ideonella sp. TaxID=1929293 RepID=UPI002E37838D|nr:lipid-binding SYLF domain-containing protein [Ideonella sp.]HEX5687398.1 lipid-binding SYLF domain-containing protein [Ideonella sp.]
MPVAIAFALTCIHAPAGATDKSEAEGLVVKSLATVQALSKDSDFAAMKSSLAQARAIIVFPRVVKAGFVLGGSGGSGVLLARDADTGTWAGPAFYTLRSASLGLQAGASSAEMVMVVNSQKALDSLYTNKLKLGAEATVVLGPKGVAKGGPLGADFVVYSKVKGAFAGVSVDGSVLDVRQSLNTAFYGKRATPTDILVKRDISSPEADPLRVAVADAAK